MSGSLSPEFRLAAACAMWPPSDCRTEAIRTVAGGLLDWTRCVQVATRHQVIGLLYDGLTRVGSLVPSEVTEGLGALAATQIRDNLAIARESLRLQRLFDDAGVPVLFLKGTALAMLAFSNLGLRSSQDIDLLVNRESLPEMVTLILRSGYSRFDPPPEINDAQLGLLMTIRKDLGFVHQETGLRIELHWRLFLNPHAMTETSIMTASRVVPITGTAGLRTLGEEDLFAYLCMHGALHWWYRLKWLADINALIVAAPQGNIERLFRAAQIRGVGRAAAQTLLLCQRLFGTRLSKTFLARIGTGFTMHWLEMTALDAMTGGQIEREPRDRRFGTTRGSLSTFLLVRGWRYRLAELNNQLTNQKDVLSVPLPKWLWFLYLILRLPLWAWRHLSPVR